MEKEKGGQLKDFFPFWEKLTAAEMESICRSAAEMTYSRGSFIHKASEDCVGVILVQAGALRVYIQSEDGRDITLFRIEEGEACILSASCFMQEITFEILIDAEEDSRVTVIPTAVFKKLSDEIYMWKFCLQADHRTFSDVMWTMQQILFMSFDRRLAVFLIDDPQRQERIR